MQYKIVLLIFAFSIFQLTQNSFSVKAQTVQISMDKNAALFLKDPRINAVSIGILKADKVYTGHYGELDKGKANTPNDHTNYQIASITKTMTGTLIAQAVLDGKINLEDDIRKFLKKDYPNLAYEGKPIQIKHLLTHTSGLPSNLPGITQLYNNKNDSTFFKVAEILSTYDKKQFLEVLGTMQLDTEPGTAYRYCNVATELLGHILETAYGKSYESLLQEYIFEPAQMPHSKVSLTKKERKNLTNGYNENGVLMPKYPNYLWGSTGGVTSTTLDMVNYMKFQLDETNPMVQKAHKLLHAKRATYGTGFLWAVHTKEEGVYYQHNGTTSGFQSWVAVYPEYDLGVFVTMNTTLKGGLRNLRDIVDGLVNDLKPSGKKSIYYELLSKCYEDMDAAIAHYHSLDKTATGNFSQNIEAQLNNLGYRFLGEGAYDKAIKIFQLIVAEYPNSANAYDSLGEGYLYNKQYDLALKNYRKSLELDKENNNAVKMIEEIQKIKGEDGR